MGNGAPMSTIEKGTPLTYLMTKRVAAAGYATYQPVSKRKGIAGRVVDGFKQRESRRYFFVYFLGKMLGVVALLAAVWAIAPWLSSKAFGSDGYQVTASDLVNPVNTIWVLVTAFLVFFMQAGFMMLEAGFARTRETSNILLECIVDTALCGLLFWAFGFAFMFGLGNGWIGHQYFFLNNAPATYGSSGVAFMAFFLFQFAFADTCSTITSGAMVGRTGFKGDILYSIGVSGFIYPIIGHWVWGPDGWLATMKTPFRDFAGSTVVHTIGGMVALAGGIVLGPRIGRKFKRDGGAPMVGHDMTIAAVGGVILWFGWYGFNPGSTLSALDFGGMGRVATNTTLAACAGALSALFFVYPRIKKWDVGLTVNGFLAGLVAITCPCYWVNQTGAILIGAVAGIVVVLGVEFMEWLRIDDPVGAVAVHGFCGIWGTLSLGLFATGQYGLPGPTGGDTTTVVTGLFWGGGATQLKAQLIGSAVVTAFTLGVGLILMYLVKATKTLRVSREGELEGLDIHEHGMPAYHPEPQFMGYSSGPGSFSRSTEEESIALDAPAQV
jgi:Amt family ammonium transporter